MPTQGGAGGRGPTHCCDTHLTERSSISTTSSATSSSTGSHWTSNSANKLSKLGRRLRESCRSLKPRPVRTEKKRESAQLDGRSAGGRGNGAAAAHEPEDYDSVQLPNESVRSKVYVAMDFSNKSQGGRILDNPRDVQSCSKSHLATKDGYLPFRRRVAASVADRLTATQCSVHTTQPWYHGGMNRDKANKLLQAHINTDGVFLVRESSVAGGFVISFTAQGKNIHSQVLPLSTVEGVVYSIDDGKTKFYDLLQLVEYYQLNHGCLPVRLLHYLSCSPSPAGEKEKETEVCTSPPSRSPSSSPPPPRPVSRNSIKMTSTSEAPSEADSAMSQDGGSEDEESSREQQG